MNGFRVGDRVRCVSAVPFGSAEEVGRVFTVVECAVSGRIRLARNAPFCHPHRFELVTPATAAVTPVERAEDIVKWFAARADGAMPPVARASCLRGMRAVMEAAFGLTFRSDAQGHVAFEALPQDA